MKDDALNRSKLKRGEDLPQSKLTNDDVLAIRELIAYRNSLIAQAKELTNRAIADKFDVHVRTIDRISTGEGWCHV